VDPLATAKLARNLAAMPELSDLRVTRASSAADACKGADIVTTVTADKRNAVILTPPMIAPGMHINGVGGDCPGKTELHPDILRMPELRVVVEFEPQSRIEGEIQQMPADYPVIELAQVLRQEAVARRSDRDITLFDSVGFALEDYSSLRFLHSLISGQRLGRRELDLVPELDDPKDLFGGTLARAGATRARKRKTA
jgi:ornithine cyclodeaminase